MPTSATLEESPAPEPTDAGSSGINGESDLDTGSEPEGEDGGEEGEGEGAGDGEDDAEEGNAEEVDETSEESSGDEESSGGLSSFDGVDWATRFGSVATVIAVAAQRLDHPR